jgi:hypothetical protein
MAQTEKGKKEKIINNKIKQIKEAEARRKKKNKE